MYGKVFFLSESKRQSLVKVNTEEHPDYLTLNQLLKTFSQLKLLIYSSAPQKQTLLHIYLGEEKHNEQKCAVKIYDVLGSCLGRKIERIICLGFNRATVISLHPSSPRTVRQKSGGGGGSSITAQNG